MVPSHQIPPIFASIFDQIPYAPALPPTLVRSLRINTLRVLSHQAFLIPSKPGRAQGWDPGPGTPKKGPPGPPRVAQGPRGPGGPSGPLGGKGAFGALGAHWGHWDNSEAIPNGIVLRFHLAGWRQARMDGLVPIFLAMDQAAQSIKSQ